MFSYFASTVGGGAMGLVIRKESAQKQDTQPAVKSEISAAPRRTVRRRKRVSAIHRAA